MAFPSKEMIDAMPAVGDTVRARRMKEVLSMGLSIAGLPFPVHSGSVGDILEDGEWHAGKTWMCNLGKNIDFDFMSPIYRLLRSWKKSVNASALEKTYLLDREFLPLVFQPFIM